MFDLDVVRYGALHGRNRVGVTEGRYLDVLRYLTPHGRSHVGVAEGPAEGGLFV